MTFRDYLTIGEVVQKLQVKFDDLSVSKLRFLEDEGLITPERTQGGYRKYSREEIERIELILRLQREKFLPLAVIKVKLDEFERGLVSPELADILQQDAGKEGEYAVGGVGDAANDAVVDGSANGAASDGYSNAHDYVSDEERYALDQDQTAVVSISEMVRDEKIPEQFFAELKRYGIVEPASASPKAGIVGAAGSVPGTRLTAAEAACVRAAWALRSVGIEPRHLRMYATFADKEALIYEQFLRPTYRHKTPRSKEMLADAAADITRQTELLKRQLLQKELRNKLGDLL
ncbi:MAG: MerR family transcriptional regulator [Coriobacteriia bacterium]|nr:MerR family transcriptional regulator [Coriobacteriia bacterium]